ncbi:CDP-diacylglycerol--inositol 3-phosphatidyltransferase [Strongylocentrotus purpuratus]|uniref:CDP-diacylglycerol--inositol 3-phosphatidyltransferase n=1 Tax=Strongylocentrotus purpuratus TaxID=7668 RepID=A0A7M7RFD9_STRPU|nr:CDP-diacylglycerol--inositol 3-phosphatidyltransferase [Strongylocentrotus purpuratus]
MAENIFMFVPNIIGYFRILFTILSLFFMRSCYLLATFLYLLGSFLDAFDGHYARKFGQGTKFGAMLDQLTDRCATLCLTMALCVLYPDYMVPLQLSATLDIASHWLHLHSSLMGGKTSHKLIDPSENPILAVYYTSRPVLFVMCSGNELFYSMMYLLYFTEGPIVMTSMGLFRMIFYISTPIAIVKAMISGVHLVVASRNMAIIDVAEREAAAQAKTQ